MSRVPPGSADVHVPTGTEREPRDAGATEIAAAALESEAEASVETGNRSAAPLRQGGGPAGDEAPDVNAAGASRTTAARPFDWKAGER
jgi:hypothetical protein